MSALCQKQTFEDLKASWCDCVTPAAVPLNLIEHLSPSGAKSCCILPETALTQAVANWLPKPSLLGRSILGPPLSFHFRMIVSSSPCHSIKTRPLSRDRDPYFTALVTSS